MGRGSEDRTDGPVGELLRVAGSDQPPASTPSWEREQPRASGASRPSALMFQPLAQDRSFWDL